MNSNLRYLKFLKVTKLLRIKIINLNKAFYYEKKLFFWFIIILYI